MESEEYTLVLDVNTSEPIYHVDGTVLIQRNSDRYQFYVEPETLMVQTESRELSLNGPSSTQSESVELPFSSSSSSAPPLSRDTELATIDKHWSHEDILKLIYEYKNNKENFASSAIRNAKVWQQIAHKLNRPHDGKQCENKFKYLKAKYLKKKDNMSTKQSGAQCFYFEYFKEMDEIFHKQPIVAPVIASSSRANPIMDIEMDINEREEVNVQIQHNQEPRSKHIRLRDTLNNLNKILKDSEDNKEKRHQELLKMHKESLNTFKSLMEKILEKM